MGTRGTDPEAFERDRLELFTQHGFKAEGRRVADREGRSTYLLDRGGGGVPAALIHGGVSEASEWALAAGRIPGRVIVPDRPGHGLSYRIDYREADYRQAAADWLCDLLDAIAADRVDLVGNSMGGYFSVAFALEHPERVRRVVLVGAPAGADRSVPRFLRLWGNPIAGAVIRRAQPSDPETFRKRVYPLLVAHPQQVPMELSEASVAAAGLPGVNWSVYTMLRRVTTLRGFRRSLMLREELARLTAPTLFLWGDADRFAPPSSGHDLVSRMPDAAIEVFADTGHLPHVERPEAVAAATARFLADEERSEPRPAAGAWV